MNIRLRMMINHSRTLTGAIVYSVFAVGCVLFKHWPTVTNGHTLRAVATYGGH